VEFIQNFTQKKSTMHVAGTTDGDMG